MEDKEDKEDKDTDLLKEGKEAYKLCCEASEENARLWLDDVKFARLEEQWPEEVKRQRETEGRPCLTINKLKAMARQVTNDARQNRPAIKTIPVDDDASEETSEILNGLIKNIEYISSAGVAYDTALEHAVYGGYGYVRVVTDYACDDAFDQDIKIDRIPNPLNVKGDPFSTAADSSDWNVAFVDEMMREEDFKKKWPKAKTIGFDGDDKNDPEWFEENSIRVAEWWKREEVDKKIYLLSDGSVMDEESLEQAQGILEIQGIEVVKERMTKGYKVTQRIMTCHEILETNEWAGKFIPIVPFYGDEFIVEGRRYFISLIRPAKDAQRMFNYWRTTSTELVALAPKAPFIGPKGAFDSDADKWDTANVKSHAYIEHDGPVAPQRQPFSGVPAGALQEAMNAADDMKAIVGIYDASLGARSNETSGKAIMARQREGDVSTFNFIDNQTRGITHLGRVIVDLIPHVYNAPRIVRIIHEDGKNESVKINQPHQAEAPNQDGAIQGPQQGMVSPEEQKEHQEFLQGVTKLYDLTVGKYDIVCAAGPSYTTKRQESAEQMMQLVQSFPQAAPLIGDLVAKNLDWPGAEEIAERLKAMLPMALQQSNPETVKLKQQLQQQQQMIEQGKQMLAKMQMELQAAKSDNQIDSTKNGIEAFKAETERMQAETDRMQAEADMLDKQVQRMQLEAKETENRLMMMDQPDPMQPVMEMIATLNQNYKEGIQSLMDSVGQRIDGSRVVGMKKMTDNAGKLIGAVQVRADGTENPIQIQ